MINMEKSEKRFALAIALHFFGIGAGAMIKVFTQTNITWISMLVVFITTFLLVNTDSLTKYEMPTKEIGLIFLYSVVTTAMCFFSEYALFADSVGFVYQAVYLLQIILLWNNRNRVNQELISRVLFYFALVMSSVAFIAIIRNSFTTGNLSFLMLLERDELGRYTVTRSSTGEIGLIALFAAMTYVPKEKKERILKLFAIIFSVSVIALSARRSGMIAMFVVVVLHLRNRRNNKYITSEEGRTEFDRRSKVISRLITTAFLFFAIFIVYKTVPAVQSVVDSSFNALTRGLRTYIGIDNNDMAVSYRRSVFNTIPDQFLNHSTVSEFFFGRGYVTDWLDVPYLEAFWDLGVVGGVFYLILQFILPLKYLLKRVSQPIVCFAQYCVAYKTVQNFANGIPYGVFFPIVLMILLYKTELSTKETKQESIG